MMDTKWPTQYERIRDELSELKEKGAVRAVGVEEVTSTLKTARKNGKAVVGMKIFGAGKLVKPEEKDASLKFVLGGNLVDAMTIGMLSTKQVDDTLERIGRVARA